MWFDLARELAAETEEANDGEGCGKEEENGDFGEDEAGRGARPLPYSG